MTQNSLVKLQIFSTLGCHLCEDAIVIIDSCTDEYNIEYNVLEITESESWVSQYGIRIPVVKDAQSGVEIDWPFDREGFKNWLERVSEVTSK